MDMILNRISNTEHGTFGVLISGSIPLCVTLEPPWYNNTKNISCIPAGSYVCKKVQSPRFGETYEVTDVKGRSHILFHAGNFLNDTQGCILLGDSYKSFGRNVHGIANSKIAFLRFMAVLHGRTEFNLIIKES